MLRRLTFEGQIKLPSVKPYKGWLVILCVGWTEGREAGRAGSRERYEEEEAGGGRGMEGWEERTTAV